MKNIILFICLLSIVALTSCGNKKKLQETNAANKKAPEWVKSRPISSSYYIGIGVASLKSDPDNYRTNAKKYALSDLASEIEVKIQSNSILYALEKKGTFNEEYLSTTKLNANLNLEGFEMVDAYESETHYYVYYRLNKAEYAAAEARKRNEAVAKAIQFIEQGRNDKSQRNFSQALNNYMQALLAVNQYIGEALTLPNSANNYVSNVLLQETNEVISQLAIAVPEDAILFSFMNREKTVGVYLTDKEGRALPNMPLRIKNTSEFSKPLETFTNNAGFIQLSPADLNIKKTSGTLLFELKPDQMLAENLSTDKLVKVFLSNLKPYNQTISYKIVYPSVYISNNEFNMGKPTGNSVLKTALTQAATERGFIVEKQLPQAEVNIVIETNTSKNTVVHELYSANLLGKIDFIDNKSGKTIYSFPIPEQKGIGLNYEAAGNDAYQKTADFLKREVFQAFLKSFN